MKAKITLFSIILSKTPSKNFRTQTHIWYVVDWSVLVKAMQHSEDLDECESKYATSKNS